MFFSEPEGTNKIQIYFILLEVKYIQKLLSIHTHKYLFLKLFPHPHLKIQVQHDSKEMNANKTLRIFISATPRLSDDFACVQYAPINHLMLGEVRITEGRTVNHKKHLACLQNSLQVSKHCTGSTR